jgi:hypothetical protein
MKRPRYGARKNLIPYRNDFFSQMKDLMKKWAEEGK